MILITMLPCKQELWFTRCISLQIEIVLLITLKTPVTNYLWNHTLLALFKHWAVYYLQYLLHILYYSYQWNDYVYKVNPAFTVLYIITWYISCDLIGWFKLVETDQSQIRFLRLLDNMFINIFYSFYLSENVKTHWYLTISFYLLNFWFYQLCFKSRDVIWTAKISFGYNLDCLRL